LTLIVGLIVVGLVLTYIGLLQLDQREAERATPMDIEWVGDVGYATTGEGQVLRLTVNGDRIDREMLAEDLAYPRGVAIIGDTLFVAVLGDLPCENPLPRCKGENVGAATVADGERQILESSSGQVISYPIRDGSLGEPRVLLDDLSFVNADHGLNDLDAGPDGMLYLSIGNLDRLAWDDGGDPPTGPETAWLGTILRIDPASGEAVVFATGLRNVFGLVFDADGRLWGVDNDGPGRGPWRFEELLEITEGTDYGFPDDGSVGPYTRRTGFATWLMPVGAGSGGIWVSGDTVISGGCGGITRVDLTSESGDAVVDEADHPGCVTTIAPMPDGRLLLGTVLGPEPFSVTTEEDLFGR
jgi:hypothetical protein